MKGMSKNLLFALTCACVVALIVFFIQLIFINRGGRENDPDSIVTAGQSGEDGLSSAGDVPPEEDPFFNAPTIAPTSRPAPQGRRWEFLVDEGTTLILYAEEEKFEHTVEELSWRFDYLGGGTASLEIGFVSFSPQSPGAAAEVYLNIYLGQELAEYKGEHQIIDSDMRGLNVQARREGRTYEMWLYLLPGNNNLALAFYLDYEFDGQRDDLYTVLSSMSIEQG